MKKLFYIGLALLCVLMTVNPGLAFESPTSCSWCPQLETENSIRASTKQTQNFKMMPAENGFKSTLNADQKIAAESNLKYGSTGTSENYLGQQLKREEVSPDGNTTHWTNSIEELYTKGDGNPICNLDLNTQQKVRGTIQTSNSAENGMLGKTNNNITNGFSATGTNLHIGGQVNTTIGYEQKTGAPDASNYGLQTGWSNVTLKTGNLPE